MVESNFEIDHKYNQQSDLSNKWPREGVSSDTIHRCVQGKTQSDRSLDKLKLRIVVRGDLQDKEIIGDIWAPTASTRTLKYFLENCSKNKLRVH